VLHRGTWHEPPFTLSQGGMALVTSHRALTEALGSPRDENGEIARGDVEKLAVTHRTGRHVRVQLP
jgi:ureidoglycolate lyase